VLIDVWASWCKDCIVGLPNLKKFQKENPEVVYLFLSLDRNIKSWKRGIDRFGIEGEHYFMQEGKKGSFGDFLNLWWIPRYVVVNETGEITLFKATKITDKNIVEALKK
jgi:thiol-disulfide isomerase/thioredoxin